MPHRAGSQEGRFGSCCESAASRSRSYFGRMSFLCNGLPHARGLWTVHRCKEEGKRDCVRPAELGFSVFK